MQPLPSWRGREQGRENGGDGREKSPLEGRGVECSTVVPAKVVLEKGRHGVQLHTYFVCLEKRRCVEQENTNWIIYTRAILYITHLFVCLGGRANSLGLRFLTPDARVHVGLKHVRRGF